MKNLILITALFWFLSCDKEPSPITPTTPTYAYDSIHKKLIGNWISRDAGQSSDSQYYYTISYDTFSYHYYNDNTKRIQLYNYKFSTKDSITGKYKDWNYPVDYKTKIQFYTDDSIKINWFILNQQTSMPLFLDIILKRSK